MDLKCFLFYSRSFLVYLVGSSVSVIFISSWLKQDRRVFLVTRMGRDKIPDSSSIRRNPLTVILSFSGRNHSKNSSGTRPLRFVTVNYSMERVDDRGYNWWYPYENLIHSIVSVFWSISSVIWWKSLKRSKNYNLLLSIMRVIQGL